MGLRLRLCKCDKWLVNGCGPKNQMATAGDRQMSQTPPPHPRGRGNYESSGSDFSTGGRGKSTPLKSTTIKSRPQGTTVTGVTNIQ